MNNPTLQHYRDNQAPTILLLNKVGTRTLIFRLFLLRILPLGFFTGLRVVRINEEECAVAVPYKWLNKNPFRSTYFAVLCMGAEMSTGFPAFKYTWKSKPGISMLVTGIKADFSKKSTGITTFTFRQSAAMREAIEQAVQTGEGVVFEALSTGTNREGKEVARFTLTWSFRVKLV